MSKYRVTVEFAHGVRHVFDRVDEDMRDFFEEWALGRLDDVERIDHHGAVYFLNRDYLCSLIVEEAEGE